MKKNGFTLIEILIVVAIIGILSTMGLMAFQKSLQRSRDARRIAEIKSLQGAAEQYYADHANNYNDTGAVAGCEHLNDYVRGFGNAYQDPKGVSYECVFPDDGASYCISTDLENNNGNCSLNCIGDVPETNGYQCLYNLF